MTITLDPLPHQHFSGTGADDVVFGGTEIVGRSINHLILTVSGSTTMSFDGTNFIDMTPGTYTFNIPLKRIWFGAGNWSGIGSSR